MSSFQDLGNFVHNNPEAEAQRSYAHAVSMFCNSTRHVKGTIVIGTGHLKLRVA